MVPVQCLHVPQRGSVRQEVCAGPTLKSTSMFIVECGVIKEDEMFYCIEEIDQSDVCK